MSYDQAIDVIVDAVADYSLRRPDEHREQIREAVRVVRNHRSDAEILDKCAEYFRRDEWDDLCDFAEWLAIEVRNTGRDTQHGLDDLGVMHS